MHGGHGILDFPDGNSPDAAVPPFLYFFQVTAVGTAVGFQSFTPCLKVIVGVMTTTFNLPEITVFVSDRATVNNVTEPHVCQGVTDVTGTLTAMDDNGSTKFTVSNPSGECGNIIRFRRWNL